MEPLTSHEKYWVERRPAIIKALAGEGYEICSDKDRVWLHNKRPTDHVVGVNKKVEPPLPSSWDEKALDLAHALAYDLHNRQHNYSYWVSQVQISILEAMKWATPD